MGNETVQICKEEELDADGRTYKLETWEMGRCVVLTRGDGFRIYTGHMYEKGGAYAPITQQTIIRVIRRITALIRN